MLDNCEVERVSIKGKRKVNLIRGMSRTMVNVEGDL